MRVALHVLRSLEHHVFEQVREARAPGLLVRRSDVVPDVHRDKRQTMVFREDDFQPVGQGVLLERDVGNVGDAAAPRPARGGAAGQTTC